MLDLLNLFYGHLSLDKNKKEKKVLSGSYEDLETYREEFRDGTRSAWMQVAAITFLQNNGFENLPEWGDRVDFSLFEIKNVNYVALEGNSLLDLLDYKVTREIIDIHPEGSLEAPEANINIEGLIIDNKDINTTQSNIFSESPSEGTIQGDSFTISFVGTEEAISNFPIDIAALEAFLAQQAYQYLLFLTTTLQPAIAQEDFALIDTITQTTSGNLLTNDTIDGSLSKKEIVSLFNNENLVGAPITLSYTNQYLPTQGGLYYGEITVNKDGNWTYINHITDPTLIALDSAQSLTISIPYSFTDGLLREKILKPEDLTHLNTNSTFSALGNQDGNLNINGLSILNTFDPLHNTFHFTLSEIEDLKHYYFQNIPLNFSLLTLTINGVNDAPIPQNDYFFTNEDTSFSSNIITQDNAGEGRDTDPDTNDFLNNLHVISANNQSVGTLLSLTYGNVVVSADGSITFTPHAEYLDDEEQVSETIPYFLSDNDLATQAFITFTINGVNDTPVSTDDAFTLDEDSTSNSNLITDNNGYGVDSDVDTHDQPLLFVSAVNGINFQNQTTVILNDGTATIDSDGSVSFIPNAQQLDTGEQLVDSFTYTLSDGTATSTSTVTYTVTGVNDAPIPQNDYFFTNEDTSFSSNIITQDNAGEGRDTDPDTNDFLNNLHVISANNQSVGTLLSLTYGNVVVSADGSITFTPHAEYLDDEEQVSETIPYFLSDNDLATQAFITFTINGVNDTPVSTDDAFSGIENVEFTENFLTNDTDPDHHAILSLTTLDYQGIAHPLSQGSVTFATNLGQITVYSDGRFTFNPTNDTLAKTEIRTETFSYTLSDGQATNTGSATLSIEGKNDAPVAVDDFDLNDLLDPLDNLETSLIVGNVLTNSLGTSDTDIDSGDTLHITDFIIDSTTYQAGSLASFSHGTIVVNPNGSYAITPNGLLHAGEIFQISVGYVVSDFHNATDIGALTVEIVGVEQPPVPGDDVITVDENTISAINLNLLSNDTDPDSGDTTSLGITKIGDSIVLPALPPLNVEEPGTLEVDSLGIFVTHSDGSTSFTPVLNSYQHLDDGDSTSQTVNYTVTDLLGHTSIGTLTVTITGVNDPPISTTDSFILSEDNISNGNNLITDNNGYGVDSDVDIHDQSLLFVSALNGVNFFGSKMILLSNGIAIAHFDGSINFTPSAQQLDDDEHLKDFFMYTLSDHTATSTSTVTYTVTGVNDAPVSTDDFFTLDEDSTSNSNLITANNGYGVDSDVDTHDQPLLVVSTINGTAFENSANVTLNNGVVTVHSDGTVNFVSNAQQLANGEYLTDSFIYTLSDGTATSTSSVTYTVAGINDTPIASNPTAANLTEGTSVPSLTQTISVSDPDTNDRHSIHAVNENPYLLGTYLNLIYGTLFIADNGLTENSTSFTYNLDSERDSVLRLDNNETATETITFKVSDGTTESNTVTLLITIHGVTGELFNNADNVVDFNDITTSDYAPSSNIYNALGGNDVIILPRTYTDSQTSGYSLYSTFHGGEGNDFLTGSLLNDTFYGDNGNDTFISHGGYDDFYGGDDNDTYIASNDGSPSNGTNVYFDGGNGSDTVDLSAATSLYGYVHMYDSSSFSINYSIGSYSHYDSFINVENIIASQGDDTIYGYSQNNTFIGGSGNDYLNGGNGNDYLDGGSGTNTLLGGSGADILVGGDNQTVVFNSYSSYSYPQAEQNSYTGEAFPEGSFHIESGTIQGDSGFDIYKMTDNNNYLSFGNYGYSIYPYDFTGIEQIDGMGGNDLISVMDNNNLSNLIINGGDGDDIIWGSINTADTINGGEGNDTIWGGGGNDTLTGGSGNDTFEFGGAFGINSSNPHITDFDKAHDSLLFYDYNTSSNSSESSYYSSIEGHQDNTNYVISYNMSGVTTTVTLENVTIGSDHNNLNQLQTVFNVTII